MREWARLLTFIGWTFCLVLAAFHFDDTATFLKLLAFAALFVLSDIEGHLSKIARRVSDTEETR